MKRKTIISFAIIAVMMAGCKTAGVNKKQVAGTMEEPVPSAMMPDHVQQALPRRLNKTIPLRSVHLGIAVLMARV